MTRHLLTLVLLAGSLTSLASAGERSELWHPDYETAASEAQTTGRIVLIHFYADWCGPCRQMESRVLNQASVVDGLADRVAAVKVNYDRRADLFKRFNVGALPCDVLVGTNGDVLLRTTGYASETTYVQRVQQLAPAVHPRPDRSIIMATVTFSHVVSAWHLGAAQHVGSGPLTESDGNQLAGLSTDNPESTSGN